MSDTITTKPAVETAWENLLALAPPEKRELFTAQDKCLFMLGFAAGQLICFPNITKGMILLGASNTDPLARPANAA